MDTTPYRWTVPVLIAIALAAIATLWVLGPLPSEQPALELTSVQEDDLAWDCRTMGNRECGVEVEGAWYVVTFDDSGAVIGVRER